MELANDSTETATAIMGVPDETQTMGIGALSKATGIPVETLRTWERRYGFPDPDRNDLGHRVYSSSIVPHLELIHRALEDGHRASSVVGTPMSELKDLLGEPAAEEQTGVEILELKPGCVKRDENKVIQPWLQATIDFDGEALESALRHDWHKLGALRFLKERIRPFLEELGIAWVEHRMEVAHEHFASERLRDFLASHWRPLSDRSRGPRVVCATLPGETHYLGLQMAAMVLAVSGCRVIYLGSDTPVDDIVSAAESYDTAAVVISVSIAANRFMVTRDLSSLRKKLDPTIGLLVGGRGAPEALEDVRSLRDLDRLFDWGQELNSASADA